MNSLTKRISACCLALLMAASVSVSSVSALADSTTSSVADSAAEETSAAVTINDENLRKAICAALGKDYIEGVEITQAEMESLTELDASNCGITDVTGLTSAVNLEKLDLSGNPLDDANRYKGSSFASCFSEFSAFSKLKELNLSNCRLGDSNYDSKRYNYNLGKVPTTVSSLVSALTSLEILDLSDNGFTSSFSTVGGNSDTIKKIDLSGNSLNGFSIGNYSKALYPSLEKIDISDNRIYWDEVVDSYQSMLEAGVNIAHGDQKKLSDLFMVVQDTNYSGSLQSYKANFCYPDSENKIYLGDVVGDSTKIAFVNYVKVNTSKATIGDDKVTVVNYDGIESGLNSNSYTVTGLKEGLNEIKVSVMHTSGDVSEYTLVVNATEYKPESETDDSEYVYIKDSNVYNSLLNQLGKPAGYKITKSDIAAMTTINLPDGVTDISWLKYAESLENLRQSNLGSYNTIKDVSVISGLTKLKTLHLKSTELEKAPDLSALVNLTELRIAPDVNGDYPDCSSLTKLSDIYVYGSKGGLPKGLDYVTVSCRIYLYEADDADFYIDASDLPSKIGRISINNSNNCTVRFGDLTGCKSFNLDASSSPNCRIKFEEPETAPVSGLTYNYDCGTSDVLPDNLNKLPNLTSLTFYEWAGDDLTWNDGFENLKNVTSVTINQGLCSSVPKQLSSMENLSSLTVSSTQIKEFDVDISNTKVKNLTLSVNQLESMPDEKNLPVSLTTLQIYNNKITDMDTVDYSGLSNLRTMIALGNPICEFPSFIKNIPNLETLQIQNANYADIPEDAFDGMTTLETLYIGNWLDVYVKSYTSYGTPRYALTEGTGAYKAVEKLKETSPDVYVSISAGSANYSGIAEMTVNGKKTEVSSDMNLTFEPGTESAELYVKAYKDDTVITVGDKTITGSGTVTLDLKDGFNNFEIKSHNDYTNLISQTTDSSYNMTVFVGSYLTADDMIDGNYYQVDCSFEKEVGGGASMAGSYFSDKAMIRRKNGKYQVYLTSNNADWTQSIASYDANGEKVLADVISEDVQNNTLQVRMLKDSVDDKFLMNLYVVPMGYAPNCYVKLDMTSLVDVTDQMPAVDTADLNAVINKALAITEKNNIYTDETWQALLTALENAQAVAGDTLSTQDEADSAEQALTSAIENLEIDASKLADKTDLKAAIDEASALEKGSHTDTAWNALQEAISDAQSVYDTVEARQSEVDSAVKALNTAVTLFKSSGEASKLDKNNLADGVYSIYADMIKLDRESKSMADNAINHTVKLEVKDGKYYVTLDFRGITIENRFGYLKNLSYYLDGYTYNEFGVPKGTLADAEVVSTQKDSDGNDIIDQYNDADNLYPDIVTFELVPSAIADEDGYVPLHVFVPIMEAIAAGNGDQDVLMKIDWSTLTKTTADDPGFRPEDPVEQSPELDYTDTATGVKIHADKGVFDEGVTAVIRQITEGADYNSAESALSSVGTSFKLYDVSFVNTDGAEVEPNGKATVSIPVPDGFTEPAVYRIIDGKKVLMSGTVTDGMYTFATKTSGEYAIVNAISDDNSGTSSNSSSGSSAGNNSSKSSSGTNTANPATGAAGAASAAAALALGAVVASKKRKDK